MNLPCLAFGVDSFPLRVRGTAVLAATLIGRDAQTVAVEQSFFTLAARYEVIAVFSYVVGQKRAALPPTRRGTLHVGHVRWAILCCNDRVRGTRLVHGVLGVSLASDFCVSLSLLGVSLVSDFCVSVSLLGVSLASDFCVSLSLLGVSLVSDFCVSVSLLGVSLASDFCVSVSLLVFL